MIYVIAFVLSVAVCLQMAVTGVIQGNISHVRNRREPNAGVSVFPMVPVFQFVELAIAFGIESVVPHIAIEALLGGYLALLVIWLVSYRNIRAELERLSAQLNDGREG